MPLRFSEATSPGGLRYLITDVGGHIDIEDGHAFATWLAPGQPHHRGYVLGRVAKGTEWSIAARKFLPNLQDKYTALAVVVTNPLARAAVKLILRISGGMGGTIQLFEHEADAVAWLESRKVNR
jgi:hypothetical protein